MTLLGFALGAIGMYVCLCRAVQMKNANTALVSKYTLRFTVFSWFIVGPISGYEITTPVFLFGLVFLVDVLLSFFNWRAYALRRGSSEVDASTQPVE